MEIIRISAIGIAGVCLAVLLSEVQPEYGFYITMTTGLLIFILSTGKLSYLLCQLKQIQEDMLFENTYLQLVWKMVGITYLGQWASGICKDSGYESIGYQVELFGRFSLVVLSMPIVSALLETIHELCR